jgi:hypothetical protein
MSYSQFRRISFANTVGHQLITSPLREGERIKVRE